MDCYFVDGRAQEEAARSTGSPRRVAALVVALLSVFASEGGAATNLGELDLLVIGVFLEGENRVLFDGLILTETEDFEPVTAAALVDLDEYVDRVSYQQASVTGQFTGPYDIGNGICAIPSLGPRLQEVYRRALDQAKEDVDLTLFNRVVFVHPSVGGCVTGSSSATTTYDLDGNALTFHGLHSTSFDRVVWIHEFGHSFGNVSGNLISHIDLLDCQDEEGSFEILSDDCQARYNFFNSMYDPMGSLTPSHFSTINKQKIGWLQDGDFRIAVDGEFSVDALEGARGGVLALKVPLPGFPYELHVEYRVPEPVPPYADPALYPVPGVIIHALGTSGHHYNIRAEEAFYAEIGPLHLTGPIVESTVYAFADTGITLELLEADVQRASIRLTSAFPSQTQCNDGIDNDGEGGTDDQDENCSSGGVYDPTLLSEFSSEGAQPGVPALSKPGLLLAMALLTMLGSWRSIVRPRAAR